jgi:hypothetical protein
MSTAHTYTSASDGHVILVLPANQGHPESPHLWKKHTDAILCKIGLVPTVQETCLCSGIIDKKRIIFKHQVDNFAIAAPVKHTAGIRMDY